MILLFTGKLVVVVDSCEKFNLTIFYWNGSNQPTTILPCCYSAHEYTESNGKFAMSVEPNNPDLVARFNEVKEKRSRGEPTVPSLMADEKKTNPFLRCDISQEIRRNVGVTDGDSDADAFGKVRKAKDNFRG